jgi:hypothetical protein
MKDTTDARSPKGLMPNGRQLLWFVALWAGGVGVTALVSYGIRLWLR